MTGERRYTVEETDIHVEGEQVDERFPRGDFGTVAAMILDTLKPGTERRGGGTRSGWRAFSDALKIYDMEARTDDRTDFYITFHDSSFPPVGFRIYSRLCAMMPLLDGGRTAESEIRAGRYPFLPTGGQQNQLYGRPGQSERRWARRMLYIESMGGVLKYNDVADKVFRSNLSVHDRPQLTSRVGRDGTSDAFGQHKPGGRTDGTHRGAEPVENKRRVDSQTQVLPLQDERVPVGFGVRHASGQAV